MHPARKSLFPRWERAQPLGYVLKSPKGKVLGSVWPKEGIWFAETEGRRSKPLPSRDAAKRWVEEA